MPSVLVTGASGLLGRSIVRVFAESGWNVTGLALSRSKEGDKLRRRCDLTNQEEIRAILAEVKPDVIVNWYRRPYREISLSQHGRTEARESGGRSREGLSAQCCGCG